MPSQLGTNDSNIRECNRGELKGRSTISPPVADELKIQFKSYGKEMKDKIDGFFTIL